MMMMMMVMMMIVMIMVVMFGIDLPRIMLIICLIIIIITMMMTLEGPVITIIDLGSRIEHNNSLLSQVPPSCGPGL